MPLISQRIPNLIGGISQQPETFRRPNQCNEALNVYSDPVSGVKKRPGSEHIADMGSLGVGYFGRIERDEVEKYIFKVSSAGIRVWDIGGNERTVNAPSGYSYLNGSSDYKYLSIADTTFLVNPRVTVNMSADLTPQSAHTGLIFIRAVDYGVKYTIDIDGVGAVPAVYTTPSSGNISTEQVAQQLSSALNSAANITSSSVGPVIRFDVAGSFDLRVFSSFGDDYITGINGEISNFGDLPVIGYPGVIVKVNQNPTTQADDYFVRFDTPDNGTGNGSWSETVAPNIPYKLDAATMPHVLVRESDGSFTFKPFEWADRVVGDEESNVNPSFVGSTLSNIFFERNRLGFLSDVNCILSESSSLSNFFRTTVSTIVDSDVIDLSVSGRQVDKLKTAIGVKDGILMFSEETQFLLNVGDADILSPETASITAISSYQSNTNVEPQRVGDSILFITRRAQKSGVREYLYESGRDFTQSASITNHVPELLPSNINEITGSSTENIVFFYSYLSRELFTYQYLYSGAEKIVSAWVRWNFADADIRFAAVFDDYLYVVLERDTVTTLERIPLSNSFVQPQLSGEICLDQYTDTVGLARTFDGTNTSFVLDRDIVSSGLILISTEDKPSIDLFKGDVIEPLSVTVASGQTTIVLAGDLSSVEFIAGTTYSFLYEFSIPYLSAGEGDVEVEGRLQVRNVSIQLSDTGQCLFRVLYDTGDNNANTTFISDVVDWSNVSDMSSLQTFNDDIDGGTVYQLSRAFPNASLDRRLSLINYTYRVPINCENTGYRLRIESDGWQPLNASKAQWEAMFHKRSRLN